VARRFKEWEAELQKQQTRHDIISLSNVEETISFDGHQIRVIIGKADYTAEVDGLSGNPTRMLRSLYTDRKEEFEALLESLTEQTDTVIQASVAMFNVATADQIPGAVLARIKGEQISDDPVAMVEKTCEARFKELCNLLGKRWPIGIFEEFTFETKVADKALTILIADNRQSVQWGEIKAERHFRNYSQDLGDAENAMLFTLQYEAIKGRLLDIIGQLREIK